MHLPSTWTRPGTGDSIGSVALSEVTKPISLDEKDEGGSGSVAGIEASKSHWEDDHRNLENVGESMISQSATDAGEIRRRLPKLGRRLGSRLEVYARRDL